MNFQGIIIAISTFLIIGLFHPIVIKTEYYFGTRVWWVFLLMGLIFIGVALYVKSMILSCLFGVLGASCLWSIKELFEQRKRVQRGWFPKRKK